MIVKKDITPIKIEKATYVDGYRVCIDFNDGKRSTVDFKPFLETIEKGHLKKYKNITNFKNFLIENGNLVWGQEWDLIFPLNQLYKGYIKL